MQVQILPSAFPNERGYANGTAALREIQVKPQTIANKFVKSPVGPVESHPQTSREDAGATPVPRSKVSLY